jgi:hypothetical protein
MTREHRIAFSLSELNVVIFECCTCKSRVALSPDEAKEPPGRCPLGHEWDWNVDTNYQSTRSPFIGFLLALRKLRDPLCERMGFRIFLEISEPGFKADSQQDNA